MEARSNPLLSPFALPPLPWPEDALAPRMSAATVRALRERQQAHVDAVNAALKAHPRWLGHTIEALLRALTQMPHALRAVTAERGAGHANMQFFWKIVHPGPVSPSATQLDQAVIRDFGSWTSLRQSFIKAALALDGEGWIFLVSNPCRAQRLELLALRGDASVLPLGKSGLLVCDLSWLAAADHPDRAEWVRSFWEMVNWPAVSARHEGILKGAAQL